MHDSTTSNIDLQSEWVKFDRIDHAARVARSVLATLIKTSPSIFPCRQLTLISSRLQPRGLGA